jgi:hypothetical protein
MVMHLAISFDTLINTLIHNQSSQKSSVLTTKILLGPPFEHVPVTLSDMLVPRKKHLLWSVAVCSVISHIIALVLDVSRLNFSIVNAQLDTSKNKI